MRRQGLSTSSREQHFIPGFEDNLIGLKKGDEKTFTLTFPKDYGVSALAGQKVTFSVTIQAVLEIQKRN